MKAMRFLFLIAFLAFLVAPVAAVKADGGSPWSEILNPDGTLNENASRWKGLDRYEARKQVVAEMEKLGHLVNIEDRDIEVAHSDHRTLADLQRTKPASAHHRSPLLGDLVETDRPAVAVVDREDIGVLIYGDGTGADELGVPASRAAPLGEKGTGAGEFLNAVVEEIGDVYVQVPIHGDTDGIGELTIAAADGAPLGEEGAGVRELLDAVVEAVGDKYVPVRIDRDDVVAQLAGFGPDTSSRYCAEPYGEPWFDISMRRRCVTSRSRFKSCTSSLAAKDAADSEPLSSRHLKCICRTWL